MSTATLARPASPALRQPEFDGGPAPVPLSALPQSSGARSPLSFSPSPTSHAPSTSLAAPLDPRWAGLLADFNLRPARWAHPSWYPTPQAAWQRIAASGVAAAQQALSHWLLQRQGVLHLHDWQLAAPLARVFLLDAETFTRVTLRLGVAAHRGLVARAVARPQAMRWREALGQGLVDFALGDIPSRLQPAGGTALGKQIVDAINESVHHTPTATGTEVNTSGNAANNTGAALREGLAMAGGAVLLQLLAGAGTAVVRRIELRLPQTLSQPLPAEATTAQRLPDGPSREAPHPPPHSVPHSAPHSAPPITPQDTALLTRFILQSIVCAEAPSWRCLF